MVARVNTLAFEGIEARPVDVQVQISGGTVAFTIVGLGDKAVGESRERVRSALIASGLSMPAKRITVNLAPADLPKEGSHYDLPIALGVLAAIGAIPGDALEGYAVLGELALDGSISAVAGVLPAAIAANARGLGLICPAGCGGEAAWASSELDILAPRSLIQLTNHFRGVQVLARPAPAMRPAGGAQPDLRDIKGQENAKRALEVAAAGGHNLLMSGSPGAGKSMLAQRLPSILPPLSPRELLEVSMIHSIAGKLANGELTDRRPFRAPHHSASMAALVGGGTHAKPGEISLAHNGVLFLDELPEFQPQTLDSLRQPIETGEVAIARANHRIVYPARFQLMAAMNPCRCGKADEPGYACARGANTRCAAQYQSRLSGPLLDRFDLTIDVPAVSAADLLRPAPTEGSAEVALRVAAARARQVERFRALGLPNVLCNAAAPAGLVESIAAPDAGGAALLGDAAERLRISARGFHRVLKLARTLADLDGVETVKRIHIAEALSYRARADRIAAAADPGQRFNFSGRGNRFSTLSADHDEPALPPAPGLSSMFEFSFAELPVETRTLLLQAGPFLALALAMVVELIRRRRSWEERAYRAEASAESLRDEVWRLKETAAERDRAEAASEAKSRFLATMSHEIRTPLHGILGMADLLKDAGLEPEPASYVEAIRASGAALSHLVDQILDFSKIEAGRLELIEEPFDARRLVEEIVELLAPNAQRKGLEIAASIAADAPALTIGDSLRLRQALTNLAGNAVKFTARGGVCVTLRKQDDGRLAFAVIDTGPGVPEDRRAKIFEDFEQGDGSHTRHFEGSGLGLAIAKRLIALMGGELSLADNPGGGSIFSFAVPLADASPAAASNVDQVDLRGRRALIVADSPFEAPALATLLHDAGADIQRAEGLEAGLTALQGGPTPDLVIVDCALGAEATHRLADAARAAGASKSLVLFSPFERRAFGQSALSAFDGWLVKPVRARSLFERLATEFQTEAPAARAAARPRGLARVSRALLAEDNDINAIIAQKALRRLGFDVVRARDGLEATRLAGAAIRGDDGRFDLVLMDVKMPGLDGYEATRAIRALEREFHAPRMGVIALSANAMPEDRATAEAAGVDAFLSKPFELARLAETIERALSADAPRPEPTRAAS